MKFDRRLFYVAIIAIIVYGIYLTFGQTAPEFAAPTYTEKEALQLVQEEAKKIGIDPIENQSIYYTDIVANSSVGRYIEHAPLDSEQLTALREEVSIYAFEISTINETYAYDMEHKRFIRAENIYLTADADQFVTEYFGEHYRLNGNLGEKEESIFENWDTKRTYIAKTEFPDIINVVDIYLAGEIITGFEQYGLARGFPQPEESIIEIIASLFILLFLVGLVIFVTIHLIIKLIKRQIEAFWEPLLITLVAAIGWLFVTKAMGGSLTGISLLDPLIMIYLTLATLLIRWKKDNRLFRSRLVELQPSVLHGFLLMIIAVLLSEIFFYIASYFDTWVSPVTTHIVLVKLDIWFMPLFTLFIGLSAAITEEAIFRNYMIPLFDRFGVLMSLLLTSFLWGILHIAYDMYPWYLYVLEFIVITGPFFYFVYKHYGFSASIFMHYFYNAWVTTLFLFTVDVRVAIVSLFVMLSPFLLYLINIQNKLRHPGDTN